MNNDSLISEFRRIDINHDHRITQEELLPRKVQLKPPSPEERQIALAYIKQSEEVSGSFDHDPSSMTLWELMLSLNQLNPDSQAGPTFTDEEIQFEIDVEKVAIDPTALRHIPIERRSRQLCLSIFQSSQGPCFDSYIYAEAIKYVPLDAWDVELAKAAARRLSNTTINMLNDLLPKPINEDLSYLAMLATKFDDHSAAEQLLSNRQTFLKLLSEDASLIEVVLKHKPEFLRDEEFQNEVFEANFNAFGILANNGFPCNPGLIAGYEDLVNKLQELRITPSRLNTATARKLIEMRDLSSLWKETRPVAVIIYRRPHAGSSGQIVDRFKRNNIPSIIAEGYRTIYFEVESRDEIFSIWDQVGTFHRIDLGMLGGEGDPTSILFNPELAQRGSLNIDDEETISLYSKYFALDAVIVLESCYNGAPVNNNMARMFSRAIPGRTIYASEYGLDRLYYNFDERHRISEIINHFDLSGNDHPFLRF